MNAYYFGGNFSPSTWMSYSETQIIETPEVCRQQQQVMFPISFSIFWLYIQLLLIQETSADCCFCFSFIKLRTVPLGSWVVQPEQRDGRLGVMLKRSLPEQNRNLTIFCGIQTSYLRVESVHVFVLNYSGEDVWFCNHLSLILHTVSKNDYCHSHHILHLDSRLLS